MLKRCKRLYTFLYSSLDVIVDDLDKGLLLQQRPSVIDRLSERNRLHRDIRYAAVLRAAGRQAICRVHHPRQVVRRRFHGFRALGIIDGTRAIAEEQAVVRGFSNVLIFSHFPVETAAFGEPSLLFF